MNDKWKITLSGVFVGSITMVIAFTYLGWLEFTGANLERIHTIVNYASICLIGGAVSRFLIFVVDEEIPMRRLLAGGFYISAVVFHLLLMLADHLDSVGVFPPTLGSAIELVLLAVIPTFAYMLGFCVMDILRRAWLVATIILLALAATVVFAAPASAQVEGLGPASVSVEKRGEKGDKLAYTFIASPNVYEVSWEFTGKEGKPRSTGTKKKQVFLVKKEGKYKTFHLYAYMKGQEVKGTFHTAFCWDGDEVVMQIGDGYFLLFDEDDSRDAGDFTYWGKCFPDAPRNEKDQIEALQWGSGG